MNKFLVILLCLLSYNSFGQFKLEYNMLQESGKYEKDHSICNNILGSTLIFTENEVIIQWKVVNDTMPGIYVIYKSFNFEHPVMIGSIPILHDIKNNFPYILSFMDSTSNNYYNYYHIVKLHKNETLYAAETIEQRSCINLNVTKRRNPILIADNYSSIIN